MEYFIQEVLVLTKPSILQHYVIYFVILILSYFCTNFKICYK